MYTKILIPLDGSPLTEQVVPFAVGIARWGNSEVTLLSILPPNCACQEESLDRGSEAAQGEARETLTRLAVALNEQGLRVRTAIEFGAPEGVILDYAQSMAIDLIIMRLPAGAANAGATDTVAVRVLSHAACPVLLAPVGAFGTVEPGQMSLVQHPKTPLQLS